MQNQTNRPETEAPPALNFWFKYVNGFLKLYL